MYALHPHFIVKEKWTPYSAFLDGVIASKTKFNIQIKILVNLSQIPCFELCFTLQECYVTRTSDFSVLKEAVNFYLKLKKSS